jgi:hypothetical protein
MRIETAEAASFATTRCRNAEMWFVSNPALEQAILGYAAKFIDRYEANLYALAIEGSHTHLAAHFPKLNRAHFMRDFNSNVARAVPRFVANYPGGKLWGRRYSGEIVPFEDVEREFFYTVLQPVNDGLVEKISEYPFYNCFHDAVWGIERPFKVVRWGPYNEARKNGAVVSISDYTDVVYLKYERLPGYEHLSQTDYAMLMHQKLEERRVEIVAKRYAEGKGFLGRENLLRVVAGSRPVSPKTSDRYTHRPRVLSDCPKRWQEWMTWYFEYYDQYREASREYRGGKLLVPFPPGTYKPPILSPVPFPTD